MKEVHYYVADDGKRFDQEWECVEYERKKEFEEYKDEVVFLDYYKKPIPLEEINTDRVEYIIVKTDRVAEAIGKWFNEDGAIDPFYGTYEGCVGTWVYGEIIDKGDVWYKLELEIEKMQTLLNEVNR